MIDERKEAQASLYVLGALPAAETQEFERALGRDLELQMLVRELRGTADVMVAAFPRVEPPPHLKASILAAVAKSKPSSAQAGAIFPADFSNWQIWVPWALAACFALLCLILVSTGSNLRKQVAEFEQKYEASAAQVAALEQEHSETQDTINRVVTNYQQRVVEYQNQLQQKAQESLQQRTNLEQQLRLNNNQAQTQRRQLQRQVQEQQDLINDLQDTVALGFPVGKANKDLFAQMTFTVLYATADAGGRALAAAAFSPQDQIGVFVGDGLTSLTPDRDYQLWMFDARNPTAAVSAGVFAADNQGHVRYQYQSTLNMTAVSRFAVTVERKGGAPQPQGRIILVSN